MYPVDMEERVAVVMEEIRVRLELLETNLPSSIDAIAVSHSSKLPWKVLLYREALAWRMAELARGAFDNFGADSLVNAIVLARAAVETTAALWYLCSKVNAAVKASDVGDIDEYLMKLNVGVSTDNPANGPQPRPVRVGTFNECVEKDIPGFSHQYGVLTEYAHPNWAGTALTYSDTDKESRVTYFGRNLRGADNTKRLGAGNLSVALLMFERSYNRVGELLPQFIKLCEERLVKQHGRQ